MSRAAGTSLVLVGETTSSNAKTDKALFETNLADSYIAGANIAVTLNANYAGSGTPTAATTTLKKPFLRRLKNKIKACLKRG